MWCSVRIAFFRGRTCSDYMFSFVCICMTVYQYDNICDLFCYIISSALYLSFECHQNHLFCRRWCGCAWWNDWRRATGTRPGSWGERSRLEGSTVAIDNWACRGVMHKWCDFFVDSAGQAFIRTDCLKSGLTCRHVKTTPTANKKINAVIWLSSRSIVNCHAALIAGNLPTRTKSEYHAFGSCASTFLLLFETLLF